MQRDVCLHYCIYQLILVIQNHTVRLSDVADTSAHTHLLARRPPTLSAGNTELPSEMALVSGGCMQPAQWGVHAPSSATMGADTLCHIMILRSLLYPRCLSCVVCVPRVRQSKDALVSAGEHAPPQKGT